MTTARTNTPTTVPGIPKPPADVSPALRAYLESLSEAVEIRLGRRGDPRDRAITLRELIDSGLASELSNRPFIPGRSGGFGPPDGPSDTTIPTAPTNFTATGGYSLITLFWDFPNYGPHSFTEIWRHTSNVIGDAQLVGVSSGISFVDPVGESKTYYYWIRHVSLADIQGPFNSASGTLAQTAANVTALLQVLTGAITQSQLATALSNRINLIDADVAVVNSVAYRVAQESSARIAAISAEASARSAAISAEALARENAIDAAVGSLQAQINDLSAIAEYNNGTTYAAGELVTYNNFLYRAKLTTTGNLPTNTTYWELLGEYSSLGDIVNQNSAAIVQINTIDATSTSAASQAIQAVTATVNNPTTGLAATASSLSSLTSAVNNSTTGLSATVTRVGALESTVNNPTTGVNATATALDAVETLVFNGTTGVTATANRVTSLETSVNSPTTGLAATRATLLNDYYTKTGTDSAIASSSSQLTAAINLKNRTFRQAAEPGSSGLVVGDLWFDSDDSNKAYRWNGTAWELTDDTRIAGTIANLANNYYTITGTDAAISGASLTLQTQIDQKNRTYRQTPAPAATGLITGDLWFDTADNNKSYRWSGTAWVATDDARIASTAANLTNNYYTKTATDSAIASATTGLVSQTTLNTTLSSYVTNAALTSGYYTATQTDSAISSATQNLVSTTSLNSTLSSYVTNSSLTTNYYTKTQTDSAISTATTGLVSQTSLTSQLGSYVTNASLTANYYTKTATDSAISAATSSLVSTTTFNNTLTSYVTNATLTNNYYTKTATDSAIATGDNAVTASFNNTLTGYATTAAVQQNYFAKADGQALQGQYTVKVDLNGYVTGFGLASTVVNGTPSSEFIIRADRFSIASPGYTTIVPFIVTGATTINGVSVPAGVYINDAYIRNGTITNAKIANAAIDNAKIASLNADKITAGSLDAAHISIDGTVLDTYYDGSIGKRRLYIPNARISNALIQDAAITNAKIGSAAVDTLKIAGNAITLPLTYSANDVYVNTAIQKTSGGNYYTYNNVGAGNGDYNYQIIYYEPTYGFPVFDYVFVGAGNGDYVQVMNYVTPTFNNAVLVVETPVITVGDAVDGGAIITFYATFDARTTTDAGQTVYFLVNKFDGNGYVVASTTVIGTDTSSGNTNAGFPLAMPYVVTNAQQIRVKILTGTRRVWAAEGTASNPSWLRDILVVVLGVKR
jgi:hypothetical protein